MKLFRKVLFWLHLSAGVFAGTVVLIMSVTGVALTYEKQMLAWADLRNFRSAPPAPDARRLPMSTLLEKVRAARGELPSNVVVRPDPADPVGLSYGREATVYANPYTGELLGEGSTGLRAFFRFMTDWHRWLGASTENRGVGKAITGACNLAFLFIVASGAYLWWPRSWRWPNVKSIVLFRGGLSGKARDFNWHNVIGFWSAVPLFFVVLSATVISYPWASDLAYRVAGEEPPARRGPGPAGPAGKAGPKREQGGAAKREPSRKRENGERAGQPGGESRGGLRAEAPTRNESRGEGPGRESSHSPGGPEGSPAEAVSLEGLDVLLNRAEKQVDGWRTITLRLPQSADEAVSFTIDQGSGGQPQLRSTLTLDRNTAAVVGWETFNDGTPGRRLRSWLRFIHTGEAGGIAGQTIAGIVSGGAVFLVYTGLALTLRRFAAWLRRKRTRAAERVLVES
jgi:uncharacterized iron-regulated membrane protein